MDSSLENMQAALGLAPRNARGLPPAYIERSGGLSFKQPFQLNRVGAWCFGLRGTVQALQDYCDATVNLGSVITPRYMVVSPFIMLSFFEIPQISSLHPDDRDKGSVNEREVNLTIPLVTLSPPRLVYYMASLWVDDGAAMVGGRETYGYPKHLGQLHFPSGLGQAAQFSATTKAIRRFGPNAHQTEEQLIRVARQDGDGTTASKEGYSAPADVLVNVMNDLLGALLPPPLDGSLAAFWSSFDLEQPLTLAFLKQFRSVADGSLACYQAVNETSFAVTKLHESHQLAGDFKITIPRLDSAPLAGQFGLGGADAQGDVQQFASFAYYLNFDFRLEAGREVWVPT